GCRSSSASNASRRSCAGRRTIRCATATTSSGAARRSSSRRGPTGSREFSRSVVTHLIATGGIPTGARSAATSAASSWSAGFSTPAGLRAGFGALLLGVHEDSGSIPYVGRVGTGFSDARLGDLHHRLKALERPTSPFAPFPDMPPTAHWVRPELVAEVTFTNWTRDGRLRHPVFVGMREDKPAAEVVRERPQALPVARHTEETIELAGQRLT